MSIPDFSTTPIPPEPATTTTTPTHDPIVSALARRELARRELARRELLPFIHRMTPYDYDAGWFHRDLCELLDQFLRDVAEKKSPRLILSVPPGFGKSEVLSRYFPPFILGRHPSFEVISATYGFELTAKFGRRVRAIMNDPKYHELFPETHISKSANAVDFIETTVFGNYNATSAGGSITGQRANILILDDLVKGREAAESETEREKVWDWYLADARTRLYPGGGVAVIGTRWHLDDLIGRLIDAEKSGGEKWTKMLYPAIAERDERYRRAGESLHPTRYSLDELTALRNNYFATGRERDWFALYQCNPVAEGGNFFKREHLRIVPPTKYPPKEEMAIYITTDLAVTVNDAADPSCVWPVGVDQDRTLWYLPDVFHGRLESLGMAELIVKRAITHNATGILLEKGPITRAIVPILKDRMRVHGRYFELIEVQHGGKDKRAKAQPVRGLMAEGRAVFPAIPWFHQTATPEILAFDSAKHDDIVDAMGLPAFQLPHLITGRRSLFSADATLEPPAHAHAAKQAANNVWTYDDVQARSGARPEHRKRGHVPPPFRAGDVGPKRSGPDRL